MTVKRFIIPVNAAGPIQNLRTTSVTQTTVAIAWNQYSGATGYQIRRNGTLLTTVTPGTTTTYTNTGHTAGTQYTYAVRPVVGGSGVASAEASIVVTTVANWEITETFADGVLTSPWYDVTPSTLTVATMPGGSSSLYAAWADGAGNYPTPGTAYFARVLLTAPTDELWFKARVWMSSTMRDGHLFYFKLSSAGIYEPPADATPPDPDHGTFYVEMGTNGATTGLLSFDTRREDGTNWDPERFTSRVIADGQVHDLTFRFVLNTPGVADGIIQAWDGTTQVANYTNWRFRETVGSKFSYMILGPYRQGDLSSTATLYVDNISLANTGTAPQAPSTATNYLTWDVETGTVASKFPYYGGTGTLIISTAQAHSGTKSCYYNPSNGDGTDTPVIALPNLRTLYATWWWWFSSSTSGGLGGQHLFRFGSATDSDPNYWYRGQLDTIMGSSGGQGFGVDLFSLTYDSGTAHHGLVNFPTNQWFKFGILATINTGSAADGALRLWINGSEVVTKNNVRFCNAGDLMLTTRWTRFAPVTNWDQGTAAWYMDDFELWDGVP